MQSIVEATKGEGEVYKAGLQSPSQTQRRCIIYNCENIPLHVEWDPVVDS
jgi:hypothetical protein